MTQKRKRPISAPFKIFLLAMGVFFVTGSAQAASVTTPANLSVSSDTATGASVALPSITITETNPGDVPAGTFTVALPTGFAFDTSSAAGVTTTGTGLSASSTVNYIDSSHANFTVNATSTAVGTIVIGSTTPLKVKAVSGTPLATSGAITLSSGTITGISATTSLGTLTQVPGAASKLAFSVQPPVTLASGSGFSAAVTVTDQFGNVVTGDSGRAVLVTNTNTASTTLSGTTTVNTSSGVANFTGLSLAGSGSTQLNISTSGLTGIMSNSITVTASSTTGTSTPPTPTPNRDCNLHNGILVKVQGSSTVYMVVNCVLRPFNTPAIFHARGKKFQNIIIITPSQFAALAQGKPVGEGSDDDDSVVVLPPVGTSTSTATSTLPNVTGLADGTIIKLPNNPTVYIVSGGQLKPFTSLTVFNSYGKKSKDVKVITQDQFNQLSVGSPATLADGALVKGSSQTIFFVKDGQRHGIPSMTVLNKNKLSLKKLVKVSDDELNALPEGDNQQ